MGKNNIEDYNSREAPAMVLNPDQHNATRAIFADWRIARTGSLRGYINWGDVSPQEIQELAYRMFDGAEAPRDAVESYFRAFNQYIYRQK